MPANPEIRVTDAPPYEEPVLKKHRRRKLDPILLSEEELTGFIASKESGEPKPHAPTRLTRSFRNPLRLVIAALANHN